MNQNTMSFLGLAKRAGKVCSGAFAVEKSVKEQKARLVIAANDASERSKKDFADMCAYYKTEIRFAGTKEELGHAIGCEQRACVSVIDEGFANALIKKLDLDC